MKTILPLLCCLVVAVPSSSSWAQLSRGTYSLGGSISYASTSFGTASPSYTLMTIQPSGSYFIVDDVDVGGHLSYVCQEWHTPTSSEAYRQLYVGINGHIYFPTGPVALFLGLGLSVSYSESRILSHPSTVGSAELGYDYVIGPSLAIDPSVSYTVGMDAEHRIRSFSIGVGLRYYITPAH